MVGVSVLVGVLVRVKVGVQVATWNPVGEGSSVQVARKPGWVASGVKVAPVPSVPGVQVAGKRSGVLVYVGRISDDGIVGGGKGFKPPDGFE